MKGFKIIIGMCILILINGCDTCKVEGDAETSHWVYCDRMGYERIANESGLYCIFDDNTSCNTYDFYYGTCGQDKIKRFRDRKLCESVYTEFEKCDEGLIPSKPTYLLEIPHCRKPFIFTRFTS